ncbi:MAG: HD-GYP domain-containing protein [Spirochaetales bacterium]
MQADLAANESRAHEVAFVGRLRYNSKETIQMLEASGVHTASVRSVSEAFSAPHRERWPSLLVVASSSSTPLARSFTELDAALLERTPIIAELDSRRALDTVRAFRSGASDVVAPPYEPEELIAKIERHLRERRRQHRLETTIRELDSVNRALRDELATTRRRLHEEAKESERIGLAVVKALEAANRHKDDDQGNHVRRVAECAATLATLHGCTTEFVARIRRAAPLHDIGKIAVPDHVLQCGGAYTDDERGLMERHTIYGIQLLDATLDPMISNIVRSHHERWDGTGYPDGLRAADIPLEARLVAVADCYDALLGKRAWRDPHSMKEAARILEESAGTHLDPDLVELVLLHRDRWAATWLEADRGAFAE